MNPNELLLKLIKARCEKRTEFNGGILTADRYVKTISECAGHDLCYNYFGDAKKSRSFSDIITKAAKTLTYNNPDMAVEEVYGKAHDWIETDAQGDQRVAELPKNTLMAFRHILTTPRKDRDGDIMRTDGAKVDPKMPLLWQHVHTLPIGKMLRVHEHTSKKLVLVSAIIDMNELSHDSAVMIDNGMGRFSHGFRALEFTKVKEGGGSEEDGFDVKSFEVMEESLVSVPSNVDAETEEIIFSLVSGGKLKSPIMKGIGETIRTKRPLSLPVGIDVGGLRLPVTLDLNVNLNGKAVGGGKQKCAGDASCGCGCGGAGASEKADENNGEKDDAEHKEMMVCPKCGEKMVDGVCTKCGYVMEKSAKADGEKSIAPYVYPGQLDHSYESIRSALSFNLQQFMVKNGLAKEQSPRSEEYYWCDIIGTYSDHVIISSNSSKDGSKYYRTEWAMGADGPELKAPVKEVEIRTTTAIIEKATQMAKALKNCGNGAGGFQPGNTCARGADGGNDRGSGGDPMNGQSLLSRISEGAQTFQQVIVAVQDDIAKQLSQLADAILPKAAPDMDYKKLSPAMKSVLCRKSMEVILNNATAEERAKFHKLLGVMLQVEQQAEEDENLLASVG